MELFIKLATAGDIIDLISREGQEYTFGSNIPIDQIQQFISGIEDSQVMADTLATEAEYLSRDNPDANNLLTLVEVENPEKRTHSPGEFLIAQWREIAREPISVIVLEDETFAYGSELACLRLAYKFAKDHIRVYPSPDGTYWFFIKYKKGQTQ